MTVSSGANLKSESGASLRKQNVALFIQKEPIRWWGSMCAPQSGSRTGIYRSLPGEALELPGGRIALLRILGCCELVGSDLS